MIDEKIKLTFIDRCIKDYAAGVVQAMDRKIREKKVVDTSALVESLSYTTGGTGAGGFAKILFKEYGRYIDMGVGRGRSLTKGLEQLDVFIENYKPKVGVKPVKIYSPIAYGKLSGLMSDLSHGLTKETISAIKKELEDHATSQAL